MLRPPLPEQFGRYRILQKLGEGGMGAVYLALDTQLDRQVALKVPHFDPETQPRALERFLREARDAAAVQHPNICPIHDVGQIDGQHYLTMGFVEGTPLDQLVATDKPWPSRDAAILIRKVALALEEAHKKGVVHRDLKPSNLMIDLRGEPIVLDFGLARRIDKDRRMTRVGAILGTPAYMSPEQLVGDTETVGSAADVYSLGVVLYKMLTGRLPFEGPPISLLRN